MSALLLKRDRDAWGPIRGFVYQVDLTIERWLRLQPNQILELEHGEDIDTVSKAITASVADQSRILEQIKARENNITLRSPQALEALASFHEHFSANSVGIDLSFRYVTNAEIAAERPSPVPDKTPLISKWEQIRTGDSTSLEQLAAIKVIRDFLSTAIKPEGLKGETWTDFTTFIEKASDKELLVFIRKIEWMTGQINTQEMARHIQEILVTEHATTLHQAQEFYPRLFLHVFKLLSTPGIKRLTVEDRNEQLALPTLSVADQLLLDNLKIIVAGLNERVEGLEEAVSLLQEQTSVILDQQVQVLAQKHGVDATVEYSVHARILDSPPLVIPIVRREQLVESFVTKFQTATWCHIHGDVGRGKSQLTILITEALGYAAWVRLRDLSIDQACYQIDRSLVAVSNIEQTPQWQSWCHAVCSSLEDGTLLVIEDIPRIAGDDALSERLIMLSRACASSGIRLLTTSAQDLPLQVGQSLSGHVLISEPISEFTDKEIVDLFAAFGAPIDFLTEKKLSWFAAYTFRHPTLLAALARYLSNKEWRLELEQVWSIIKGEYADQLRQHTQSLLKSTVPDESSRELLYRLNLVRRSFTAADVRRVSDVAPAISLAFEKIDDSIGLWIQRDDAESYLISPLLFHLGGENLSTATQRGVHLAVGISIVERKRLGPSEALQAISHFCLAKAYNSAGTILLLALTTMRVEEVKVDVIGISELWHNTLLPEEMDLDLRLHLRASQIALGELIGKDISFPLSDLDSLLEEATEDNDQAVMAATMIAGPLLDHVDVKRAGKYLLKALAVRSREVNDQNDLDIMPKGVAAETLVWAIGAEIRSAEDLHDWLTTLEQFTPGQIEAASEGIAAEGASLGVPDRLWIVEENKSGDRDWDAVLDALRELTVSAHNLGMDLLWAGAIRSSIIVLIAYKKDIDRALELAKTSLTSESLSPAMRFAISEVVGFQLFFQGQEEEALTWLMDALSQPTVAFPVIRTTTLLILSQIVGRTDYESALPYVQQSVEIARTSEVVPEIDFVKSLGELSIAQFLASDLSAAYLALEEAAEHLLSIRDRSTLWKDAFLVLAHVTGYLEHLSRTGKSPQFSSNGTLKDSPPPTRGLFLTFISQPGQYQESGVAFLAGTLSRFAENTGNLEYVSKWALRAFDIARESGERKAQVALAPLALSHLIAANRVEESIDVSLDVGAAVTAIDIETKAGRPPFRAGFDLYSALGERNSELWIIAENRAAGICLVPLIFKLGTLKLTDSTQLASCVSRIANTCRQLAMTAAAPELWNGAAETFEEIFTDDPSFVHLISQGNELESKGYQPLGVICYVGASLSGTPDEALPAHLAIFPAVFRELEAFQSTFSQNVVPFVRTFWLRIFREHKFRFSNPPLVEQQLREALTLPDEKMIQEIFRVVAAGLAISLNEPVKHWLDIK